MRGAFCPAAVAVLALLAGCTSATFESDPLAIASASAEPCAETRFTPAHYEFYGRAETELLVNKNPSAALAAYNQLMQQDLNCYERSAARRIGVAIKVETKDYAGAARDLEAMLTNGELPEEVHAKTYDDLAELFEMAGNPARAARYRALAGNTGDGPR